MMHLSFRFLCFFCVMPYLPGIVMAMERLTHFVLFCNSWMVGYVYL